MTQGPMSGKTILLTGGNSGIGLCTAGQLAQKGARVVITARSNEKARKAQHDIKARYGQDVEMMLLHLDDFDSIRQCAATFLSKYERLDVLINNAGLNTSDRRETKQGFEYVLGVNHVGPFLFTNLLLDRLKSSAPARIVCLSSAAHMGARKGMNWDDLQRRKKFNGQAYCQVKLGTIYWVQELAKRYAASNITAYAVNPRLVATNFAQDGDTSGLQRLFFALGKYWMLTPDEGARTITWAASEPGIENLSGQYFQDCAPRKPSRFALDSASATRWWDLSEQWVSNGRP
jgi:NAD(P)-dependent dehydrogenase (short-subunit alcohol dehydrogenase family)